MPTSHPFGCPASEMTTVDHGGAHRWFSQTPLHAGHLIPPTTPTQHMKLTTFTFTAANGTPFLVRLTRKGERFGLEMCLTYGHDEPTVEFYDTRHPFCYAHVGPKADGKAAGAQCLGQFTGGAYYLSTLRETRLLNAVTHAGLNLNGGVTEWRIDAASLKAVHAWLDTVAHTGPVIAV